MEEKTSVLEFIRNYSKGVYDSKDTDTMIKAGWYDWFCRDTYLKAKLDKLFPKVVEIAFSGKINIEKSYVFFKNNCPMFGSLYDDFRICDISTGDVLYTIIPASGHESTKGRAELWGRENNFEKPIVTGTWKNIKAYFGTSQGSNRDGFLVEA
jgi:hypothetical protein